MIVRPENGRLELFAQDDHAAIAGRFAEAWGAEGFARIEPRQAVIEAIRLHDRAWVDSDCAPCVRPSTGRPRDFMTMRAADSRDIWTRSIDMVLARVGAFGAQLVSRHFDRLAETAIETSGREEDELEVFRRFRAEQDLMRATWARASAGQTPNAELPVARAAALLAACDNFSIALLTTNGRAGVASAALPLRDDPSPEVTFRFFWPAPRALAISPWPFKQPGLRFETSCRAIPDRDYRDDADLREAFRRAPVESIAFNVLPAQEN